MLHHSPFPIDINEKESIKTLVDNNSIVITCGGGAITVIKENNELMAVDGVIDKDFSSAKVAELIKADKLVILTTVNKVKINYNLENGQSLDVIDLKTLSKYIDQHQFVPGSMLTKIQAVMNFISTTKLPTMIGSLQEAKNVINQLLWTKIIV